MHLSATADCQQSEVDREFRRTRHSASETNLEVLHQGWEVASRATSMGELAVDSVVELLEVLAEVSALIRITIITRRTARALREALALLVAVCREAKKHLDLEALTSSYLKFRTKWQWEA